MSKEQAHDANTPTDEPQDSTDTEPVGEAMPNAGVAGSLSRAEATPSEDVPPPPDIVLIENERGQYCPINQVVMTPERETSRLNRWLFGRPLRSEEALHDTIGKRIGLTVFAPDVLSSVAYATEEILYILILAGVAALSYSIPIAGAICVLLILVMLSYRQVTFAYPNGGGSYVVTRDNLGKDVAQVAGAALLTDYVLTVAVSVSAGVEQVVSAAPTLNPYRVIIAIGLIFLLSLINLRSLHVQLSRTFYAAPAYLFLVMAVALLGVGFWRMANGTLHPVEGITPHLQEAAQPLTLFLILRAFSSGSIALTGLEEISNRITAFREPRSRNASTTILAMSGILMVLFMGITVLANHIQAVPNPTESVISQLAGSIFDHTVLYTMMIAATTIILLMAANRSYAGFPRLAELQADDGFMPHWFALRGYRLAPSWGIVVLSFCATVLIIAFNARVNALIPLYAVGVFLSFTLAQAGMVVHWRRVSQLAPGETRKQGDAVLRHDPRWRPKLIINATGCVVSALVTLVFAVTKFSHGAWVVILVMAVLVALFFKVKKHYDMVARSLSLDNYHPEEEIDSAHHTVVTLVGGVHRGTLVAARYAHAIRAHRVVAVHVEIDPEQTARVRERWEQWMPDLPLVVVDSPYRTLVRPLVRYVNTISSANPDELVTIVIPQFVCVRWWHHLLHNQTALLIRSAFLFDRNKVVIEVPFRLEG